MGLFDDLISIDKNGNITSQRWIEWEHIPKGSLHCFTCLALDKCWFNNSLKPEIPQHEGCHCMVKKILKPIVKNFGNAKCDLKKFTEYIFSDKYAWNGKRNLFELLGFKKEDAEYLQKEYARQALIKYYNSEYVLGKLDKYGQRINIDIEFIRMNRKIVFNSGWVVRPHGVIKNTTPLAG